MYEVTQISSGKKKDMSWRDLLALAMNCGYNGGGGQFFVGNHLTAKGFKVVEVTDKKRYEIGK